MGERSKQSESDLRRNENGLTKTLDNKVIRETVTIKQNYHPYHRLVRQADILEPRSDPTHLFKINVWLT